MKRILLSIVFLLMLCAPAWATQVTLSSFQLSNYRLSGTTATIRVYVSQGYLTSDGTWIPASPVGGQTFYKVINCTIASNVITVPSTVFDSTDDGRPSTARMTFILYDARGTKRDTIYSNYRIPIAYGSTMTIAQLVTWNTTAPAPPRPGFPDTVQVQTLINQVLPVADASDVFKGKAKLSVAPVSATNPIAVGDNDPRLSGVESQPFFTLTATDSSGQTFTQIDQTAGGSYPAYAGLVSTAVDVGNGNQFANVFRTTIAGSPLCANRPAGHQGPPCYKVPLLAEGRTTAGQVSDYGIWGGNFVVETNSGHVGPMKGLEIDLNQGSTASPTLTLTSTNAAGASTGLEITGGGNFQIQQAIRTLATNSNNKFQRLFVGLNDSYTHRAIEVGDSSGVNNSIGAEIAVRQINSRDGVAVQAQAGASSGNAFAVYNESAALLSQIAINGEFVTSVSFRTTGGVGGFQAWKDGTPSKAIAFAAGVPGAAVGNDAVISTYSGGAWAERFRVYNGFNALSLGAVVNIWWGSGSPEGAVSAPVGSLFLRIDGGANTTLYVKESGVGLTGWIGK